MKKFNWTILFLVFFIFAVNAYAGDVEKKDEIKKNEILQSFRHKGT